jgi:hypothetical protein
MTLDRRERARNVEKIQKTHKKASNIVFTNMGNVPDAFRDYPHAFTWRADDDTARHPT